MHAALSLNNMAVVLETLTEVSVEASKQCNERAEKNQSTRQLTPVQITEIHTVCSMMCVFRWMMMMG